MKKNLFVVLTLANVMTVAQACGQGETSVSWPRWKIESNELRYMGVSHNGMPLYNLVDGNPKTAWVWSGLGGPAEKYRLGPKALVFNCDRQFWVDEVRILTGYNKTNALWKRNNRVKNFRILLNRTDNTAKDFAKTVSLSDSQEWHSIKLPPHKVSYVGLDILSQYRGRDNDLCISEVAFYNRGRKIDFHLPRVVLALDGGGDIGSSEEFAALAKRPECKPYIPDSLFDRKTGRLLSKVNSEEQPEFSPNNKLVYIVDDGDEPASRFTTVKVFDTATAQQKWRRSFRYYPNYPEVSWKSDRQLAFQWSPKKQQPIPVRFVQFK